MSRCQVSIIHLDIWDKTNNNGCRLGYDIGIECDIQVQSGDMASMAYGHATMRFPQWVIQLFTNHMILEILGFGK